MLRGGSLARLGIPQTAEKAIRAAWEDEPPALYGRMDLAYDGCAIKLLEYNADTPTSLVEASVIQWRWLEDRFPNCDQWNSLHSKLVEKWRDLADYVAQPVWFAHDGAEEDALTVAYLRDTACEAGLRSGSIPMADIGWDEEHFCFVDAGRQPIGTLFKLYPWEQLLQERFGSFALQTLAFGQHPAKGRTQWIEPIWKLLWSSKALLAVLWELFPDHPLLLPAYLVGPRGMKEYARKPLWGREGANIALHRSGGLVQTDGPYGEGPWIYQGLGPVPCIDGNWVVLGSWLIDGEPPGLGVREGATPVIRNADRFVPHLFSGERRYHE